MAEEFHYLSRSHTYLTGVSVFSSNGSNPTNSFDRDNSTAWTSSDATPTLVLNLGAARTVNRVHIRHNQINTWTLGYGSNGAGPFTDEFTARSVASSTHDWYEFPTDRSFQYWQIEVDSYTTESQLFEIILASNVFKATDGPPHLPSKLDTLLTDPRSGGYNLQDGSFVAFNGENQKYRLEVSYQSLPQTQRDLLEAQFRTPLTIYPEMNEYPNRILQVNWLDTEFPLIYRDPFKGANFSGTLRFIET